MSDCETLQAEYRGLSVKDIPELASRLDEMSCDSITWIRVFRCRNCGQLWEERYEATGHGEVPTTRKIRNA